MNCIFSNQKNDGFTVSKFTLHLQVDEKILESYAKSWTSGVLDKAAQRDSMAFTLVKHHLSGFIFQCSASGKTLRYKVVKSLLRCYARKPHHEVSGTRFLASTRLCCSSFHVCLIMLAHNSHCFGYFFKRIVLGILFNRLC
jgi:hypothetical protein